MDIKRLASSLAWKHGTRDPIRLAKYMGYLVIYVPLEGIRGFYQYVKRCHIIYLDEQLDEHEAAFVCAHELGHSLLHRGCNRIFMDRHTHMVTSRYELEADRFAVDLLFDDYDLQDLLDCSITTVADCLGVPLELAEYRINSVEPVMFSDYWG